MHWLQTLDANLFLFLNRSLVNPFCDWLMPVLSGGNELKKEFVALAVVVGILLFFLGNARLRVCVVLSALVVGTNDGLVCNTLKHAVARPRPFVTLPQARVYGRIGDGYVPPEFNAAGVNLAAGKGSHNSMPSSHAANWFAATMTLFLFYRRSLWIMLPLALGVSFSRIYNGVHYPSDVLASMLIGAGYAAAVAVAVVGAWQTCGEKYFPRGHEKIPRLMPNLPRELFPRR